VSGGFSKALPDHVHDVPELSAFPLWEIFEARLHSSRIA
jgi:hypothetical protein